MLLPFVLQAGDSVVCFGPAALGGGCADLAVFSMHVVLVVLESGSADTVNIDSQRHGWQSDAGALLPALLLLLVVAVLLLLLVLLLLVDAHPSSRPFSCRMG